MAKKDDLDKVVEMGKDELVWALNILLSMNDMPKQLNKLDKAALFRLFDQFQERGQAFATLDEKLRDSERENLKLQTEVASLENKLKKARRDLKNTPRSKHKGLTNGYK